MFRLNKIAAPDGQTQILRLTKRLVKAVHGSRVVNCMAAIVIAAVLLPLMFCLACIARVVIGRQFISRHQRLGLHAETFQLINFRSIPIDGAYSSSSAVVFCHFLESTGLAALPQIFNVIKGDMNLVGPHPTPTLYARANMLEKPGMFQQSQTA